MHGKTREWGWMPGLLAAVAFVGFVATFAWEVVAYQRKVVEWARRDLQSRAELMAVDLAEPLRTQDFPKIHQLGKSCQADGYSLAIFNSNGRGKVYASDPLPATAPQFTVDQPCEGGYLVRLRIPVARVMRPFRRALVVIVLAALVGMAGVLLFFLVVYRQRVRIRELTRLEKFRREFIADVSHEIKTPLTGILGASDMLADCCAPDAQKPLLAMIKKESTRLNGLVQAILDLARLEREGEALNRAETDIPALVEETVGAFAPQAEAAGIALRFVPSAQALRTTRANVDGQLVAQAVSNLIANAIRHSGSREIAVSVASGADEMRIAVEDHGVGIPPEHADRVFERFHRVDPARAAETGGAGLGLAIVRRIARLHGGDVTLSAVRPHGCRFELSLAC